MHDLFTLTLHPSRPLTDPHTPVTLARLPSRRRARVRWAPLIHDLFTLTLHPLRPTTTTPSMTRIHLLLWHVYRHVDVWLTDTHPPVMSPSPTDSTSGPSFMAPTPQPTNWPTTPQPTTSPTSTRTFAPSARPTPTPTFAPSAIPTSLPHAYPPTAQPTAMPTTPWPSTTAQPTTSPTNVPTTSTPTFVSSTASPTVHACVSGNQCDSATTQCTRTPSNGRSYTCACNNGYTRTSSINACVKPATRPSTAQPTTRVPAPPSATAQPTHSDPHPSTGSPSFLGQRKGQGHSSTQLMAVYIIVPIVLVGLAVVRAYTHLIIHSAWPIGIDALCLIRHGQ
jgi:hypothetical protein